LENCIFSPNENIVTWGPCTVQLKRDNSNSQETLETILHDEGNIERKLQWNKCL